VCKGNKQNAFHRRLYAVFPWLMLFMIAGCSPSITSRGVSHDPAHSHWLDPFHASYQVEGRGIQLKGGRHEVRAAPGSATMVRTFVFGQPAYGDLDGDGDEDAVLLLVHLPGGSGTFYYIAAALFEDDKYFGTNAVFIGDRVAPQTLIIRDEVVVCNYADRRPGEAMAVSPSIGQSRYLTIRKGNLTALRKLEGREQVLSGQVVIGHEVRSFTPCLSGTEHWLVGESPALEEVMRIYRERGTRPGSYIPCFMTLAGRVVDSPKDGFGMDYKAAFFATELVRAATRGNCKSHVIVADSPLPGQEVTSPLRISGRARGTWFFEGDFPLVLYDADGEMIARGFAAANGEWMTRDFVPFEGILEFTGKDLAGRGSLILKKDNPADRPELDDQLEIPVLFDSD
jgi:hypothetical protein